MGDNVNKVILGSRTLLDLTEDTVTPEDLLSGVTAHSKSGDPIVGSLIVHNVIDELTSTSTEDALSANQGKVLKDKIDSIELRVPYIAIYGETDWDTIIAKLREKTPLFCVNGYYVGIYSCVDSGSDWDVHFTTPVIFTNNSGYVDEFVITQTSQWSTIRHTMMTNVSLASGRKWRDLTDVDIVWYNLIDKRWADIS